jgi:hypothetical protein
VGGFVSGQTPWRRSRLVEVRPDPAAGADWTFTVPAGKVWEVISAFAVLVTDATVANRAARLVVGDGVATFLSIAPAGVQAASLTYRYAWVAVGVAYQTANGQVAALPRLVLEPGWTLGTSTEGLVAGDNWGVPSLLVLETEVKGGPVAMGELPELYVEVVAAPRE